MQTATAQLRIWLKEKAVAVALIYFHGSGAVVPSTAPVLCKVLLPYSFDAQCPEVYQKALPDLIQVAPALSAAGRWAPHRHQVLHRQHLHPRRLLRRMGRRA
eukprot:13400430-Alexandrium_andersonii.AAC.1